MSTVTGGQGNIVTNGLVLNLDAANPRSYPQPYNGTTWFDISGNSRNGTLTNGPTYNSANGGSIVFDGGDDYVDTSYITSIGTNEFTYCAWVKFSASQQGAIIIKRIGAPSYQQLSLFIAGDSGGNTPGVKFAFNDVSTTSLLRIGITTQSYNDNKWHYVVLTRNSTSTFLYIDGTLSTSATSTSINLSSNSKLFIGRSGDNQTVAGLPLNGSLANIMLYNKQLSSQEVLQNFNATRARFGV